MSLPPLPPPKFHAREGFDYYTPEHIQAYGQTCREAALEEAASICNGEQWHNSARPVDYIEAFNEGCGDCESAIRRLK